MQEQNFEKQVQQKMEAFTLTPSVPVWQKVEKEIGQKKKRRRVLLYWFIPFMLVGAGMLVWNVSPSFKSIKKRDTLSNTTPSSAPATPSEINTSTSNSKQQDAPHEKGKISIPQEKSKTTPIKNHIASYDSEIINNSIQPTAPISSIEKEKAFRISINKQSDLTKDLVIIKKDNKLKEPAGKLHKELSITNATNETIKIDSNKLINQDQQLTDTVLNTETGDRKNPEPTILQQLPKKQDSINAELPTDSALIKKGKKKEKQWSFAIQALYGISSSQTELLSNRVFAADFPSSPLTSGGFNGMPPRPSAMEKGKAIGLSALVKQKVNQRVNITTGISYHRFSVKTYVGEQIRQDTTLQFSSIRATISAYYRNERNVPLKEYKNNYHFIEVPFALEWQPFKQLPFHWQTGVSLSYLVATNALIYDPAANIYYKNDKHYSKTQLHFQTGLTYRIWQFKQGGIHTGPYLQYGLTGMQRDKENNNYHLLSTGLKVQYSF